MLLPRSFFQSCDKNTEQFFCVLNIPDIESFILPGMQAIITTGYDEAQVFFLPAKSNYRQQNIVNSNISFTKSP